MEFLSVPFGALVLGMLFAFHALRDGRWRQAVVGVASAVYLGSFVQRPLDLSALGLFLALGYGLVLLARAKPGALIFGAGVVLLIACFAWMKQYTVLAGLPQLHSGWVTVGLSYVLFRVLQLAIDEYQGEGRAPVGPLAFLLFTCSLFTFVTGPIQRYDDHRAQLSKLGSFTLDAATAYAGSSRIANGLLKVALVSTLLREAHGWLLAAEVAPAWVTFGAASLLYLGFLYANFSGSIDVVLGLGALVGFALPENFDRPFRAGNLLEFWNRWHLTLSQWFKFYVFNPLLKLLGRWAKTPSSMVWAGVAGYFATFFLMGLWHGTTAAYVIYGALLGAGVAGTKLYEAQATRRLGKKGLAALRARPLYAAAARGFTLAYLAVALALWWKEPAAFFAEPGTLLGGLLFAAVLVMGASLPFALSDPEPVEGESKGQPLALQLPTLSHQLWLGARAFVLAALAFDTSFHVSELIYRGF